MIRVRDYLRKVRDILRHSTMDLDADLHPEVLRVLADLMQRLPDPPERGIRILAPWHAVGTDLNPRRADVVGEADVRLGPVDVLAHFGWVGGMVLEGAAEPREVNRGILELLTHLAPLIGRER